MTDNFQLRIEYFRSSSVASIPGGGFGAGVSAVAERRGGRRHGRHGGVAAAAALALAARQPVQRGLAGDGLLRHLRQLDRPRYGHLHGSEPDDARRPGAVIARARAGASGAGGATAPAAPAAEPRPARPS